MTSLILTGKPIVDELRAEEIVVTVTGRPEKRKVRFRTNGAYKFSDIFDEQIKRIPISQAEVGIANPFRFFVPFHFQYYWTQIIVGRLFCESATKVVE